MNVNEKYFWSSKIQRYKYSDGALSRQPLHTFVIPTKSRSGESKTVDRSSETRPTSIQSWVGWVAGWVRLPPPAAAALLAVAAHFDLSKQQNQVSGRKLLAFELFKFFYLFFCKQFSDFRSKPSPPSLPLLSQSPSFPF